MHDKHEIQQTKIAICAPMNRTEWAETGREQWNAPSASIDGSWTQIGEGALFRFGDDLIRPCRALTRAECQQETEQFTLSQWFKGFKRLHVQLS